MPDKPYANHDLSQHPGSDHNTSNSIDQFDQTAQQQNKWAKPEAGKLQAVALRYDKEQDPVPRILAKGQGTIAEQILEMAYANNISVREDAELATILSMIEIDSLIPLEAFAAVAEIIAYLYQLNDQRKSEAATPSSNPLTTDYRPTHQNDVSAALSVLAAYEAPFRQNTSGYASSDSVTDDLAQPGDHINQKID